jgi:hypothetical protein
MCCECVARDKEHNDETEAFDMVAGIVAAIKCETLANFSTKFST